MQKIPSSWKFLIYWLSLQRVFGWHPIGALCLVLGFLFFRYSLEWSRTIRSLTIFVHHQLLLSSVAYIIPHRNTISNKISFALYFLDTQIMFSFPPTYFFVIYIFVLRKCIRMFFLNLCEWKCIHHKGWCYSLILKDCLTKKTSHTKFYSRWHESTSKDNALCVIL